VAPDANPSGTIAAASPWQDHGILARTDGRLPNGRFSAGNRFSRRHGKRSAGAVQRRKQGAVGRKLAAAVLAKLHLLPGDRCRPKPLRVDQLQHLDPDGLALLRRLEVASAGSFTDS
jgi:hypothetical protein